MLQNFVHNRFAGSIFCFRFVSDDHPMSQDIQSEILHVLWNHLSSSGQKRIGSGCQSQIDGRTRRSTELNQITQL